MTASTRLPAARPVTDSEDRLFHRPGLIYFWCLNDRCEEEDLFKQIDAYAVGEVAAVCLHPRDGLEFPYGGDDWFELIARIVDRCKERGLPVWLYDEDPFPSGAAGGRITMENPEYAASRIVQAVADPALKAGDNFAFGPGRLIWAGLVDTESGETVDLTARVGMIRTQWTVLNPWNSKFYYPETPLYDCPRAWTCKPQFGLRLPEFEPRFTPMAFIAEVIATPDNHWWNLPDSLNAEVTRRFLELTHERYRQTVGHHFGSTIKAIFTDEPKCYDATPYTRDMFESFVAQFGYDLRPHLYHLFSSANGEAALRTRLHFRRWCGQRFHEAWLKPVANWCREHGIHLVGHISPEDDPIQQVRTVDNLMPLFGEFSIPGVDIIVPAIGDSRHPLLSIGTVSAVSAAQQADQPGVLSESLGLSSHPEADPAIARRIIRWQAVLGVTTLVVHGAFSSMEGNRAIEAPPDFGPKAGIWPEMAAIQQEVMPLQDAVRDATQIAPVALLWPIRSFAAQNVDWQNDESGLRPALVNLLADCLDRQVGTHFLDEAVLWAADVSSDAITVGRARYSHIVVPASLIWHAKTVEKLRAFAAAGGHVHVVAPAATWTETDLGLEPAHAMPAQPETPAQVIPKLPRLMDLEGQSRDIRVTVWQKHGQRRTLAMNLRDTPAALNWPGGSIILQPGEARLL